MNAMLAVFPRRLILSLMSLLAASLLLTGASQCQSGDNDGDGWTVEEGDCDDSDPAIYPGAPELCNQRDDDCDGQADESGGTWYQDADQDGYGSTAVVSHACAAPDGFIATGGDCSDSDPSRHPGAVELCNGLDDDCDGNSESNTLVFYRDDDGDGYGHSLESIQGCTAPAGYADKAGDCDDADPAISPGAPEICDGLDNNCNHMIDEGFSLTYPDADRDGFGDSSKPGCTSGSGRVAARGDCNDTARAVHPGADDPAGDGIDQDCGGFDGPQPHVGLAPTSLATLQAALNAAPAGSTVWVGPGTYAEHDLSFAGKSVTLISTRGAAQTTIDAASAGRGFIFTSSETAATVLDGFTVSHGISSTSGAGAYVVDASPTIRGCVFTSNSLDGVSGTALGAGMYLERSQSVIAGTTFSSNSAGSCTITEIWEPYTSHPQSTTQDCHQGEGGGLYALDSSLTLSASSFTGNKVVGDGGGLYLKGSSPSVSGVSVSGNSAGVGCDYTYTYGGSSTGSCAGGGHGGGLYLAASQATVADSDVSTNVSVKGCYQATNSDGNNVPWCVTGQGGGLYLDAGTPRFQDVRITGNQAANGGGLGAKGGAPTFQGCLVSGNQAVPTEHDSYNDGMYDSSQISWLDGEGGAMWFSGSSPTFRSTSFVANTAGLRGGALSLTQTPAVLESCLFADNVAAGKLDTYHAYTQGGETSSSWPDGGWGGALYLRSSSPSVTGCLLTGNSALRGGGAYLDGSSPALTACTFSGNRAMGIVRTFEDTSLYRQYFPLGGQGAALYLTGSSPLLEQLTLAGNTAVTECVEATVDYPASCSNGLGGGLYLLGGATKPAITESILAYDTGYELYVDSSATDGAPVPSLAWSDLYASSGPATNLSALDATVSGVEPGFLAYGADGLPTDLHLAKTSPLIDAGDPAIRDVDGSLADLGGYGGPDGEARDLDADGFPDWFWPGTLADAPAGFRSADFDAEDRDGAVH